MPSWSDVLKTVFLGHEQLLIGWLLGMLSPAVIEEIRRKRRLKLLGRAIAQELHELQFQMALRAFVFRERAVKLDDDFLSWFEQTVSNYKGSEPVGDRIKMIQLLRKVDVSKRGTYDPTKGMALSEGDAALLSVHTNEIALFPLSTQTFLLNVSKHLKFYNQHVAYLRRLFDKTFDNLSEKSRANVQQNLEDGYAQLARRAVWIADSVNAAPSSLRK